MTFSMRSSSTRPLLALGRGASRHSSMAEANSMAIGWSGLRPSWRYSSSSGMPDQNARSNACALRRN